MAGGYTVFLDFKRKFADIEILVFIRMEQIENIIFGGVKQAKIDDHVTSGIMVDSFSRSQRLPMPWLQFSPQESQNFVLTLQV